MLEDRIRAHPLVSQVVVVGDQRPFIAALVTLDAEMLPGLAANARQAGDDASTRPRTDPDVLAALDRAVETRERGRVPRRVDPQVPRSSTTDFTEANGYLTPSLKVKRALVLKDFASDIDTLYTDTRGD